MFITVSNPSPNTAHTTIIKNTHNHINQCIQSSHRQHVRSLTNSRSFINEFTSFINEFTSFIKSKHHISPQSLQFEFVIQHYLNNLYGNNNNFTSNSLDGVCNHFVQCVQMIKIYSKDQLVETIEIHTDDPLDHYEHQYTSQVRFRLAAVEYVAVIGPYNLFSKCKKETKLFISRRRKHGATILSSLPDVNFMKREEK